jgi:tetratricopeptide (TPR) repeat protein
MFLAKKSQLMSKDCFRVRGLAAILGACLMAGPMTAAEPETAAALRSNDTASPPNAKRSGWNADLDLRNWPGATFYENYKALTHALSEAHGAVRTERLVDFAELYLSQMLTREALEIVTALEAPDVEASERFAAVRDAAFLLNGKAIEAFAASPLADEKREDRALWHVLQAISDSDLGQLSQHIDAGFSALGQQSRPVIEALLPVLVEAAIETGKSAPVATALRLMEELPDLAQAPVLPFLKGRAAEAQGKDATALAAYFEAAKGRDQFAARARLAVAEMSLEEGSRGALLAALAVLIDGTEAWRGDRLELETLKKLVRVQNELGERQEALLTLAMLISRFPDRPETKVARRQAATLLRATYTDGVEGRLALSKWMNVHMRVLPLFRDLDAFPIYVELFADKVNSLGATDLAAQEYQRAISHFEEGHAEGKDAPPKRLDSLRTRLTGTYLRGGQATEAAMTFARITEPEDKEEKDRFQSLKAEVLAAIGDDEAFLKTIVNSPSPTLLRRQAVVLEGKSDWDRLKSTLQQLWHRYPALFDTRDATQLLIAARRTSDDGLEQEILRRFPSLTKSKPLINIAKSFEDPKPSLMPLSRESAQERLNRLRAALDNLNEAGLLD